jgi:hypothetical protein
MVNIDANAGDLTDTLAYNIVVDILLISRLEEEEEEEDDDDDDDQLEELLFVLDIALI